MSRRSTPMKKNDEEQLESLSKVRKMVQTALWTSSVCLCEVEKWEREMKITPLCLFYNLEFGTLDAWRIQWMRGASKQSLSCSEIWAFDLSGCVAHSTDAWRIQLTPFRRITSLDAWRIYLMRGASDLK